jgi:serine/threonine-protein kinase
MPLVEGASLRARMIREGMLGLDEAIRVVREVASALQHAHDHGVIHRDVKPENILLTPDGGVTHRFRAGATATRGQTDPLTESGLTVGTAWYMSPEQASGDHLDARADQYARACSTRCSAGTHRFRGEECRAFSRAIAPIRALASGTSVTAFRGCR